MRLIDAFILFWHFRETRTSRLPRHHYVAASTGYPMIIFPAMVPAHEFPVIWISQTRGNKRRMATNKTTVTAASVEDFINSFAKTEQKRKDSFELIRLMQEVSGFEPKMWGLSIIGFGSYHYKYASGHEGDAPMIGFSPRKSAISLYVFSGLPEHEHLLQDLGKFKMGKACIYASKLSDIHTDTLKKLMKASIDYLRKKYGQ